MGRARSRTRQAELRDLIERYTELASEATAAGAYTPAVTATQRMDAAQVELRRVDEARRIAQLRDPAKRARRMAQLALAEGSYIAAEKLEARASALEAEAQAALREQQLQDRADLSAEELIDVIVAAVGELPYQDVERVLSACEGRLR